MTIQHMKRMELFITVSPICQELFFAFATQALNKATLPYILELLIGVEKALNENEHLANGLNIKNSEVVHEGVKEALSA